MNEEDKRKFKDEIYESIKEYIDFTVSTKILEMESDIKELKEFQISKLVLDIKANSDEMNYNSRSIEEKICSFEKIIKSYGDEIKTLRERLNIVVENDIKIIEKIESIKNTL